MLSLAMAKSLHTAVPYDTNAIGYQYMDSINNCNEEKDE